jgi:hypothetical protein
MLAPFRPSGPTNGLLIAIADDSTVIGVLEPVNTMVAGALHIVYHVLEA